MGASLREEFEPVAREAARYYGIPEEVFIRLITQESGWDEDVIYGRRVSSAGAQGIAQFMPATAEGLGIDPLEPEEALWASARYLKGQTDYFDGDLGKGVAAYNAGAGGVQAAVSKQGEGNWFYGLPEETQTFLKVILPGGLEQKERPRMAIGADSRFPAGGRTGPGPGPGDGPFRWPQPDDYKDFWGTVDYDAYYKALESLGDLYGWSGLSLPAGAPEISRAAYEAAKAQAAKDDDPTKKQLALAQVASLAQQLRQGDELFPLTKAEIEQRLEQGSEFFPLEKQRLEQDIELGERRQRMDELGAYIDKAIGVIGSQIQSRGLKTQQAVAEFNRQLDAFTAGANQFRDIQRYTIPQGVEYVPGFEPGGFATSIGLQPWKASPIDYNPFQMAVDIVNNTPSPLSIGAPELALDEDPNYFADALRIVRETAGVGG